MPKEELVKTLLTHHVEKLPEWYCIISTWGIPEGFPSPMNVHDNIHVAFEDPLNRLAADAVREALGPEGCSKAWWLVELKRTEAEWYDWYHTRRNRELEL